MAWTDTIGVLLDAYGKHEQNKIDSRLAASREQVAAYGNAARWSQVNAQAEAEKEKQKTASKWIAVSGLAVAAGVVYWMVKVKK